MDKTQARSATWTLRCCGPSRRCDGVMSATNLRIDARKVEDETGDRVVITFDGKFLPYQW